MKNLLILFLALFLFSCSDESGNKGKVIISDIERNITSFHCPITVTSGNLGWCDYQLRFEMDGFNFVLNAETNVHCDSMILGNEYQWEISLYSPGNSGSTSSYRSQGFVSLDWTRSTIDLPKTILFEDGNVANTITVSTLGEISCN